MSVNRFEIRPSLLCARPEALLAETFADADAPTLIVDIREDWTEDTAFVAAQTIIEHLASNHAPGSLWLRVGLPDADSAQEALGRLAALRPGGIVLSGCGSPADVQKLDAMLRVAEAEGGLPAYSIAILAEVGGMPEFFLSTHSLRGISARLRGIVFDALALARATGSQMIAAPPGRPGAPMLFARAAVVLLASQAALPCYELAIEDALSVDQLTTTRDIAFADGFSGLIARNTDQLTALAMR